MTAAPREEQTIGRYRVVAELGRGGMGVVYLADDPMLGRSVALKLLDEKLATTEEIARRFLREARAAAAVTHPNIATIYDVGEHEGRIFLAMELVVGASLRSLLGKGPLAIDAAISIASGVASALAKAHEKGIVHRDLKPENVMVTEDGQAKVLDFGLAKVIDKDEPEKTGEAETLLTREGTFLGTPAYASPEQMRCGPVDARTDVWSFGVLLFEMLVGERPFQATNAVDLAVATSRDPAPAPSTKRSGVTPALDAIVLRCLEKDPADRFASGSAIVEALRATATATASASASASATASASRRRDDGERRAEVILLERVREFWIEGVLHRSLNEEIVHDLAKDEQLAAVDRGFDLAVERLDRDERPIAAGTSVDSYFEKHQRALLILGEPGAGKTVTLLELTRALLDRAERDASAALPVVLSLSTFAHAKEGLAAWIVEQMSQAYRIPKKVATAWVEEDRLALMLDGLDEVKPSLRDACVAALNRFRDDHGLAEIAVGCRREDYAALGEKLKLGAALQLRSLDDDKIDAYLTAAGPRFAELADAIARDAELRELARSPLMLSIMSLAYSADEHASTPPDAKGRPSHPGEEDRRLVVFDRYIERMFRRREGRTSYDRERTIRALSATARAMQAQGETVLQLENLQPSTWLPRGPTRFLYFLTTRAALGVLFAAFFNAGTTFGSIVVASLLTLVIAALDYRIVLAPRGTYATKRAAVAYFASMMLLMGIVFAVTFWLALSASMTRIEIVVATASATIAYAIPATLLLASRRRRLALGADVTTVENVVVRWTRFAILAVLLVVAPSLAIWYPFRTTPDVTLASAWDTRTGKKLAAMPSEFLRTAAIDGAGDRAVVTRASDARVFTVDLDSGHATDTGLEGGVALDDEARLALVFSREVKPWKVAAADPTTLRPRVELAPPAKNVKGLIGHAAVAPDDHAFFIGASTASLFYDEHGAITAMLPAGARVTGDGHHAIAFDPLRVIDTRGVVVAKLDAAADDIQDIDLAPSGTWVAGVTGAGCLRRIDLASPSDVRDLPSASCSNAKGNEAHVRFDATGARLLVEALGGAWIVDDHGKLVAEVEPPPTAPMRVVFHTNESNSSHTVSVDARRRFVVRAKDGHATIFRFSDGAIAGELPMKVPSPWAARGVEVSDDGAKAIVWSDGTDGFPIALFAGTLGALIAIGASLRRGVVRLKSKPNQGIALTLRTVLAIAIAIFAVAHALFVVATRMLHIDSIGVSFAVLLAAGFALGFGGFDLVNHVVIRVFLALRGELPLRAARFLDGATQQIFLRKVGGGYMFIHRLVLEYFANDAEARLLRSTPRQRSGT